MLDNINVTSSTRIGLEGKVGREGIQFYYVGKSQCDRRMYPRAIRSKHIILLVYETEVDLNYGRDGEGTEGTV